MKTLDRKDFIKKACVSGACLCGFSSIALAGKNKTNNPMEGPENSNFAMTQAWISNLLVNINKNLTIEEKRKILKSCSIAHYDNLKMEEVLSPYEGNIEKFIGFLEDEWDWKVDYNKSTKTLIADENKNYCVCPIINKNDKTDKSAMCYCSEGFAEKMFSVVSGVSASATVISSIHRGNDTCKYKVVFE